MWPRGKLLEWERPIDLSAVSAKFPDIVNLFPAAEFVRDEESIIKFRASPLVLWLKANCGITLQEMHEAADEGRFSVLEFMKFYMDLGLAVSGFAERFRDDILEMKKRRICFEEVDW